MSPAIRSNSPHTAPHQATPGATAPQAAASERAAATLPERPAAVLVRSRLSYLYEHLGAATGVLGAALLAAHSAWSPYGWIAFLCSNMCMIAFGVAIRARALVAMQLAFTATSVLGIWRAVQSGVLHVPL